MEDNKAWYETTIVMKYNDLVKKLKQEAGAQVNLMAVEVGARGFGPKSAYN